MSTEITRMSRTEASAYLKERHGIIVAPKTLANRAVTGDGPKFQKAGQRTIYRSDWLDEWAEAELSPVVTSTAELSELQRQGVVA